MDCVTFIKFSMISKVIWGKIFLSRQIFNNCGYHYKTLPIIPMNSSFNDWTCLCCRIPS
jgi:hypothetical protein